MAVQAVSVGFLDVSNERYSTEKPFYSTVPFTRTKDPKASMSNVFNIYKDVDLHDVRGHEDELQLDIQGFEIIRKPTTFDSWLDGRKVVDIYYPELESFLKSKLNASKVLIYDHTYRQSNASGVNHRDDQPKPEDNRAGPSRTAHIDFTYEAAVDSIERDCGVAAPELLKGRFQVVNIWRPLSEPVLQDPLVLCDWRTVEERDAMSTDLVWPHRITEIKLLSHSPAQKWYYLSEQKCDEMWCFKILDSQTRVDGDIAGYAPHTSVRLPNQGDELHQRESVEFRAYVFCQSE